MINRGSIAEAKQAQLKREKGSFHRIAQGDTCFRGHKSTEALTANNQQPVANLQSQGSVMTEPRTLLFCSSDSIDSFAQRRCVCR